MLSIDQQKKQSFDKERQAKLDNTSIKCKEYYMFSNRQIEVWAIVEFKTLDNTIIKAKVVKKPFYMDKFGKARYRWFLVCELENENRFVTHVDCVLKK